MPKNISVIVPVFNEEENLFLVLKEIYTALKKDFNNFEIIIVDDHSSDNSLNIANSFASDPEHNAIVIQLEKNYGSGKAIYIGIMQVKNNMVIYIPADGQFDCSEIIKYAEAGENADIVLGIRSSRYDYNLFRKINSKIYIVFFNFLFNSNYKDINWIHLWKTNIFKHISIQSKGIFFLGELIVKAKACGYNNIIEIPSKYLPRKKGVAKGGKLSSVLKVIKEMIYFKLKN